MSDDPHGQDEFDTELGEAPRRTFSNPVHNSESSGSDPDEASDDRNEVFEAESAADARSEPPRRGILDSGVAGLKSIADVHVLDVGITGIKNIGIGAVDGLQKLRGKGTSDDAMDPRTPTASRTFKRLFKMMDYNRDHSLRVEELIAGLQVLQHAWEEITALYTIDKVEFVKNQLATEAEQRLYDEMVEQYAEKSIADLTDVAKEAWRHANIDVKQVPNADATSDVVNLVLNAEKENFAQPSSQLDDKGLPSAWLDRALARRKELEGMSFSDLKDVAGKVGVRPDELLKAEGWGTSRDTLVQQILEVKLSQLCRPRDVVDTLLSCSTALTETLGGKLPSSTDFATAVEEMLEEDEQAVSKARNRLQKDQFEQLQHIHVDDVDENTTSDHAAGCVEQTTNANMTRSNDPNPDDNGIHPEYDRLLHFLTDPYLLHIVLPQLEAWQLLFNIFDLRRNGCVALSELQQGLSTACSPEIEIIQTANMVHELLKSMVFVVHEQNLIKRVIHLTVDNDPGFGSRSANRQECTITRLKRENPSAVRYCIEAMQEHWENFIVAVRRVAVMSTSRSDLDNLDQIVYGLRYVAHTMTSTLNQHLSAPHLPRQQIKDGDLVIATSQMESAPEAAGNTAATHDALRKSLVEFKRNLTQLVIKECTAIMDEHSFLYRLHYGNRKHTGSDIIRKYVSSYLLRRRLRLLARIRQWEVVSSRVKRGKKTKSARPPQTPLIKLQAMARGAIGRRRLQNLKEIALLEERDPEFVKQEKVEAAERGAIDVESLETTIAYFDWPSVLIQYLKSRPQIRSLKEAALRVLAMLKAARTREERIRSGNDDDLDDEDDGYGEDGPPFPEILLDEQALQKKLATLQQTLNNWNEMLMMLDENSSGSLNPMELRCSLMAFSQMGLISEMREYQPMDAAYRVCTDRIYKYPSYNQKFRGKLGWDQSLVAGTSDLADNKKGREKANKKHLYWENRRDYHVCAKKYQPGKKSVLPNYPLYTTPGSVVLMGVEGVAVGQHPWALQVELQFDETDPAAYVGAKKYSVLVSSYRNNAIVARLSGTLKRPGMQLLLIKNEAFVDASTLLAKCKQYELDGRPDVKVKMRAWTNEEDRLRAQRESKAEEEAMQTWIDTYPRGEGLYEITPFIPMEQLRWYRLEIQGDKLNAVDTPGKSEDHKYMLRVRIDPLVCDDDDGQYYIEGKKTLKYDSSHDCVDHSAHFEQSDTRAAAESGGHWSHAAPGWKEEGVDDSLQGGKDEREEKKLVQPWFSTVWTGHVDYADFYSIGNVYNNLCSDASDDVEWSIGPLRNFSLFSCNRGWLNSRVKYWPDVCPREDNEDPLLKAESSPRSSKTDQRNSSTASSSPHKAVDQEDLRYWLNQAYKADDQRVCVGGRWVVKGRYSLSASLRRNKRGMLYVRLRNDWNVDYEPGFPYSNGVVFRKNPRFLDQKATRTTKLIKAMLGEVPSTIVDLSVVPQSQRETEADGSVSIAYWRHTDTDTEMDSNALFIMRGETAKDDPGLNVLFTGKQLKAAMKHMTRTIRVNPTKCKLVTTFLLWPLKELTAHCRGKTRRKRKVNTKFGALETVLYFLRRNTGSSTTSILWAVVFLWILLVYTIIGSSVLKYSALHSLEPVIAASYYIWASALCALEIANEVSRLPSDTPYDLAYKQANLSMVQVTVTRIQDGQSLKVTAMGLLQMVCRLHEGEEDEEDEEDEDEDDGDDEEADPFHIGRGTLDIVWTQHDLRYAQPFVDADTSPADVIYDYELRGDIQSQLDWEERNGIYMQGMQTEIDTGKPTPKAQLFLCLLSLLNASIGMLHRWSMGLTIVGDISGEGSIVIACAIVTFVGSYIVLQTLFRVAFQWYTVLMFMEQLAHVLIIDGAMRVHLPCYIDLRHEGNLEGWYCARDYLNTYCNTHIFGMKSQSIIASSLIISAIVSFNAVTNYFSDSANIDWSNPGGWFSLLNMVVLAALLFLALVALERINAETTKLVKKLDSVGIEVSRTTSVAQSAKERILDDEERIEHEQKVQQEGLKKRITQQHKMKAVFDLGEAQRGIELISHEVQALRHQTDLVFGILKKLDVQTNDIINRQEIATEYQYLQNIIAELRDQAESKKIFGLVVDRIMLSRIFGGVAAVIYLILKETMDALIVKYAPPTFPVGVGAGTSVDAGAGAPSDLASSLGGE